MEKNLDEKSLIIDKENTIFHKIRTFFLKLFGKKEVNGTQHQITNIESNEIQSNKPKETFIESIRNIETEETKLLELQKQYDARLINTNDLPKDKIKALINLYKKQISELSKSNEERKAKLLQYRNKMQNA